MLTQVKLLVTIITTLTCFSIEIHGSVLDKSRVSKSSMVHHTINSMEVSTKINRTLPSIPLQTKQQFDLQLIPKNIDEVTNVKRKGKIFSDLSFLTGLGIGSLATSAIIPGGMKLSGPAMTERLQPPTITPINSPTITPINSPINSTELVEAHLNPFSLAQNNLLYQTLKSTQDLLERLKMQPKELSNLETFSPMPPALAFTPPYPFMINRRIAWNPDVVNDLNESDGTSQIKVLEKSVGHIGSFNCSALKDIIRETIKESNVFNDRRQAEGMDDATTESTTIESDTTTTIPPTTTQIPPPQSSTMAGNFGYYGGNAQNLNGINLVSPQQPSTSYGYPHSLHSAYGPTIYSPDAFHQRHFQEQHQEYYNPEIVDEYPSGTPISSGNYYSNGPDQWPIYPPYARTRKRSTENGYLVIGKSGFVPSHTVG